MPPELHGTEVLALALCCAGDPAAGERAVAPFELIAKPIADVIGPAAFAGWQPAFDPLLTAGERNDWKSHDFLELSDGLIDVLVEAVPGLRRTVSTSIACPRTKPRASAPARTDRITTASSRSRRRTIRRTSFA